MPTKPHCAAVGSHPFAPSAQRGLRLLLATVALSFLGACALFGIDDNFAFDLPIQHTEKVDLPLIDLPTEGSGQQAPQTITLPFDAPAMPIDLASASPDLKSNRDKLKRLEIASMFINPKTNTLNAPLPPLDLYIGPLSGATVANSVKIATISVPAASTQRVTVPIDEGNMELAQPYLTSLAFSFLLGPLVVQQGQSIPGGSAQLELELTLRAVIDPTK